MAARSSWKGFLKLSLVSIPVKAYTVAVTGGGKVALNQIHAACHTKVNYKKRCPIHGDLESEEIVSGYEIAKDQFVVIKPEELDALRTESDKAVNIQSFVSMDTFDPIYFEGKNHYLMPDGPVGEKPYALLVNGMKENKRYAVAEVVMHGKEQIVLLRPHGRLLVMSTLKYAAEVQAGEQFETDLPEIALTGEEVKLVSTLIKAQTPKQFDYSVFHDKYTLRLTQLIEAKVSGKEIVVPKEQKSEVNDLLDALKRSVEGVAGAQPPVDDDEEPSTNGKKAKKTEKKRPVKARK